MNTTINLLPIYFQGDMKVSAIVGILAVIFFFSYPVITALKRGKFWFWLGVGGIVFGIAITAGTYFWRLPRGLSGTYYDGPDFSDTPLQSLRYFETPGQRVDRFIRFDPNDFNYRYPFSNSSFSVKWEGYIYLPTTISALGVESNFATELSIDDATVQLPPSAIDIGTSDARSYLGKGWSFDEKQEHRGTITTFAWSSGEYSDIYLGIEELADYRVNFRGFSFQYPECPEQKVTVAVNGTVLDTITFQKNWDWNSYTITVPRAIIQQSGTETVWIRLSYSNPVRPANTVKRSADRRKIAIALDRVSIENISENTKTSRTVLHQQNFSPGIHRISLKAHSSGENPFIQLVLKRDEHAQTSPVLEDYLFPPHSESTRIERLFVLERAALGLSIAYKWGLVFLLAGLLVSSLIFPELQNFRWKRFLTWPILLLIGILAFGFFIRLCFILEMPSLNPSFNILPRGTDHSTYWFFARGFFRGYWPFLSHDAFYHAPLASFYFILCSMLFGESILVTWSVTALLSTCSLMFVFGIARRTFNNTVAYIAVLLCACNGVLIFYDTSFLLAPLVIFLNLATLWLMYKLREHLSWRTTIMLGLVIGLTGLARANIVLLMPFFLLWMLCCFPGTFWHKISHYACIGLIAILTILPVSIRNYSANNHHWVWTNSNGGVSLWFGNNPSATGTFVYSEKLLQETRARIKKEGTSFYDEVLRYVKERPGEYAQLEYQKFKMFWRGYEIGNNLPYYVFRQVSNVLGLPWLNFVLLGPLGIIGMILALKHRKKLFILYSFIGVQLVTTLIFIALARYRLPAVPVFSIFAAYTIWYTIQCIKQHKWLTCVFIIGSIVFTYLIINYPYAAFRYQRHYKETMPLVRMLRYWDLFHLP